MLLYLLLQEWLNTSKEGKKSLNDVQGNVNLPGQAVIESLLYLSFSKMKMRRQNHDSFHKVCLNIVIIHYIFSNFN